MLVRSMEDPGLILGSFDMKEEYTVDQTALRKWENFDTFIYLFTQIYVL